MIAPNFSLPDQNGVIKNLHDFKGKWVVLYFYPKDNTPGCTKQACAFRDGRDLLASLGAEVVGISKDTTRSHGKFSQGHNLNFTLLSDRSGDTIKAYGSWRPKKFMGREFLGINRDTFLINPNGEIVKKYENVDVTSHFEEVYKDLKLYTSA